MPALLRVDVLGTPVLTVGDRPLVVDTRKASALLAVLATALADGESPVSRDRLAALFWPEADDARARGALRRTLSVLVSATTLDAGPAVRSDRMALSLDPALVASDVVRFAELSASEDPDDWASAAGLLRGEFLSGLRLRDCPPFDDWVLGRASTLRRDAGELMERLVRARLRSGDLHAALAGAVRWLELDPLHEPAHRTVMRLLAWTGRRQDALDAYHQCVRVLADELGVAPVRATSAVFEAIRTGTLVPPARAATGLTAPRAPARAGTAQPGTAAPVAPGHREGDGELPLTGRDAELRTLLDLVRTGRGVAVVTGENGIGRSRLLREFAARLDRVVLARAHEGEAGLAFAPVADLLRDALPLIGDRLEPAVRQELSRILPELPGPAAPPLTAAEPAAGLGRDRLFEAIVQALAAAGPQAVVLDDVHAVSAASADFLSYLLYRTDRLGCPLVLSWRTPCLPGRHPVRLALATGRPGDHGEPVTNLPLSRLTAAQVASLPTDLNAGALMTLSAGLPLVLAGAIRAGSTDSLGSGVRELLAARLSEVAEESAQVMSALAVCGGVADQRVLRATSGRSDLETVEAIEQAMHLGLIDEEGTSVVFRHDALRQVAYDGLSLVRRRLLHARAAEALMAADPDTSSGLIAHHWHLAGRDELAAQWGWTAATRAARLYAHSEVLLHLEFVTALGPVGELGPGQTEAALAQGDALVALGRYDEALAAYARAASLALTARGEQRAEIERRTAGVHARVGDWDLADSGLAAALELAGPDRSRRAALLADRALLALRSGQPDPHGYADAAAAVAYAGDVQVQNVLGLVALARGDSARAVIILADILNRADGPGGPSSALDDVLRTAVLNNLAQAQAANGDHASAVATAREALARGQRLGDRHRLAALHSNLADRLHDAGDMAGAMAEMTSAASLFAEVGADPLGHPHLWTLTAW